MLSQHRITTATPMGACLVTGSATFKLWAPRARAVYLNGRFGGKSFDLQMPDRLLFKDVRSYWTGFQTGALDCDAYCFYVIGTGTRGYKRDPYARELILGGVAEHLTVRAEHDRQIVRGHLEGLKQGARTAVTVWIELPMRIAVAAEEASLAE